MNGRISDPHCILRFFLDLNGDGGMKRLPICMFDSDFCLQQVRILHLDVKVENVELQKSTSSNLKKNDFYMKYNDFYRELDFSVLHTDTQNGGHLSGYQPNLF